ncbi:MAG: DUF3426 domain-containing protein [Lysobacter sp.]
MFVPCPHCGFLVALIVAADGPAQRCPRCKHELRDDDAGYVAPPPIRNAQPFSPNEETPGVPDAALPAPEQAPSAAAAMAPATTDIARPRPPREKRRAPSFVRAITRPRSTGPRWPGALAIGLLTVSLLSQLLLAQRNELAADARWRPVIGTLCTVLACRLPAWHEPTAYTMLARSVQPANGQEGVLSVQASFRNDARWPQAWPALLLNLSDINGETVARRVFTAQDYHPADAAMPPKLAPGQSASVNFEIVEPAPQIVAFTFDFR